MQLGLGELQALGKIKNYIKYEKLVKQSKLCIHKN